MKKIILCLVLSWMSLLVCGQENFEGRIFYKSELPDKVENFIEAYFGKTKLLLQVKNKNKISKIIYDFKEKRSFTLQDFDSVALALDFSMNDLSYQKNENDILEIVGYDCKKVDYVIPKPLQKGFKKIEAWFSPDLFYKQLDTPLFTQPPFIFFNENSISLKTRMQLNVPNDDSFDNNVELIATTIKNEAINDSIFNIPSYFRILTLSEYVKETLTKFKNIDESLKIDIEKIEVIKSPSSPPPPPPPPPPSKPPPYKSKATKKKIVLKPKK